MQLAAGLGLVFAARWHADKQAPDRTQNTITEHVSSQVVPLCRLALGAVVSFVHAGFMIEPRMQRPEAGPDLVLVRLLGLKRRVNQIGNRPPRYIPMTVGRVGQRLFTAGIDGLPSARLAVTRPWR